MGNLLKKLLNALLCKVQGHKRGKRIGQATTSTGKTNNDYECPRCQATWTRRVKA